MFWFPQHESENKNTPWMLQEAYMPAGQRGTFSIYKTSRYERWNFSSTHNAINQLFWCAIRNPFCLHGSLAAPCARQQCASIGNKSNEYRLPGREIYICTLRDAFSVCLSISRAADLPPTTTTFHRLGAKRNRHACVYYVFKRTHWN